MTEWYDEAMGVNHAAQIEYRENLLNGQEANYDDYYGQSPDVEDNDADDQSSRHAEMSVSADDNDSDEFHEASPYERDVRNGFVTPQRTPPIREFDASTVPDTRARPQFDSTMSRFRNRDRMEPTAKAMQSLRRENEVPLSIMDQADTSNRNEGLHRSGIFPAWRPVDPGRAEAAADYRNNLRPQLRKNRAIGSAREAGMRSHRGPIASTSRWGRFKDLFRGNGVARSLFRLNSHATVQRRRLERKLDTERLDTSRESGQLQTLRSLKWGENTNPTAATPQSKWGGVTYRSGPSIAEVDADDESMD